MSKYTFQFPLVEMLDNIIWLHSFIMHFLLLVVGFVVWLLVEMIYFFGDYSGFKTFHGFSNYRKFGIASRKVTHGADIEIIWTLGPCVILIFIAVPSFSLLYAMESVKYPSVTFFATGNQWYWNYKINNYLQPNLYYQLDYEDRVEAREKSIDSEVVKEWIVRCRRMPMFKELFDSYMLPDDEIITEDAVYVDPRYRLLETDEPVVLPYPASIQVLVTSVDVLHAWTVPVLGVKTDAIPGRLNRLNFETRAPGVYYGQCSELCGVNHGFMPIQLKIVDWRDYENYVSRRSTVDNIVGLGWRDEELMKQVVAVEGSSN